MAKPPSDAMKANMGDSLSRRPVAAMGHTPGGSEAKQFEGRSKLAGACTIDIEKVIADPLQPRTEWDTPEAIDELERLAASLKARGQLQPIRVRWLEDQGVYMVVVGGRRLKAATMAGLKSVECVVISGNPTPEDILEDQLVENALRLANSPTEQARSYERLIAAKGYTQRQLADRLNVDHTLVTRALGLLTLPEPIQEAVDSGEIKPTVAYEISKVPDAVEQSALADRAKAGTLKRDELRARVAKAREDGDEGRGAGPRRPPAARPAPMTYEDDDVIITIRWKRAGGRPLSRIAGDFVRWAKMQVGAMAGGAKSDAGGQGGEADAA